MKKILLEFETEEQLQAHLDSENRKAMLKDKEEQEKKLKRFICNAVSEAFNQYFKPEEKPLPKGTVFLEHFNANAKPEAEEKPRHPPIPEGWELVTEGVVKEGDKYYEDSNIGWLEVKNWGMEVDAVLNSDYIIRRKPEPEPEPDEVEELIDSAKLYFSEYKDTGMGLDAIFKSIRILNERTKGGEG